ncbi:uncharacterized protein B0I36DRAFT_356213 [Microdochium trichocladiopsis]|uniref:Uncharacterized protein n=1 Tax=Microdochium trichocladiopsis TaxID=1682393 RepID=A0A9P8XQH6_9PEZI|nr:uncharacterized protein B0I36DRAFT_356213 [Microdochium trichocladiopsis]KAH7012115.1 hypothetical protein B0I36DRAFT_356213 [Microdochium trichocladiopsis]
MAPVPFTAFLWQGEPLEDPVPAQAASPNSVQLASYFRRNRRAVPDEVAAAALAQRRQESDAHTFEYAGKDDFERDEYALAKTGTAWLTECICTSVHGKPRDLVEECHVSCPVSLISIRTVVLLWKPAVKTIQRLFTPKVIVRQKQEYYASFDLETSSRVLAMACYLFLEKKNTSDCTACTSARGSGPGVECVVGGHADLKHACTNCYYSGTSKKCSLRVGKLPCSTESSQRLIRTVYEEEQARAAALLEKKGLVFNPDIIAQLPLDDVKALHMKFEQELENRRAAVSEIDVSQGKKRRMA